VAQESTRRYAGYEQEEAALDLDRVVDRVLRHFGLIERIGREESYRLARELEGKLGIPVFLGENPGAYPALVVNTEHEVLKSDVLAWLDLSRLRSVAFRRAGESGGELELEIELVEVREGRPVKAPLRRARVRRPAIPEAQGEGGPGLGELVGRIEQNLAALRLPELVEKVLQHYDLIERLRHYYKENPRGAAEEADVLRERLGISVDFVSGSGAYPELVVKPPGHLFGEDHIASLVLSKDAFVAFYKVGEGELEVVLVEEGEGGEPVRTPLGRFKARRGQPRSI